MQSIFTGGLAPLALTLESLGPLELAGKDKGYPIVVNDRYTVDAGTALQINAPTGFQLQEVIGGEPRLYIAGSVVQTWGKSGTVYGVLNGMAGGYDNSIFLVQASGDFEVHATSRDSSAYGFYSPSWSADVTNNGRFEVTAAGQAWGAESWDAGFTFINTGDMLVDGDQLAVGVHPITSGTGVAITRALVTNTGSMIVHSIGGEAIGVMFDERGFLDNSGTIDVTGYDLAVGAQIVYSASVINSGVIQAQATASGGISVGLMLANYGYDLGGVKVTQIITNSGLIQADVAIYIGIEATFFPMRTQEVIYNTGQIVGAVALQLGDDEVHNAGRMLGAIDLGNGEDLYDGLGERAGAYVLGGQGMDRLLGGRFADFLSGDGDNDAILGGAGADTISGGRGSDALDGGAGIDTLSYLDAILGVRVDLAAGTGQDNGVDLIRGFEVVIGGRFDDTLVGSAADETLRGAGGDDSMTGGAGTDVFVFIAGDGADTVTDFAAGQDHLLIYGYGAYQSLVQEGADTCVVLSGGDSILLKGVDAGSLSAADFRFDASGLPDGPPSPAPLQTQLVSTRMDIAAGELFELTEPFSVTTMDREYRGVGFLILWMDGVISPVLVNAGEIHVSGVQGTHSYTGIQNTAGFGQVDNQASGKIIVEATGSGDACGVNNANFMWNEGLVQVTASAFNAQGVFGDGLMNSGDIQVSAGREALGVYSSEYLWNLGDVSVHGDRASMGAQIQTPCFTAVNSGTISVTDDTVAIDSVGLSLVNGRNFTLWNSGLIEGDYALRNDAGGEARFAGEVIYNSGELRGLVTLGDSINKLYNTGEIDGLIDLGKANDIYDGRHGAQSGGVLGGGGDDTLLAGAGADSLDGGAGNDVLGGGAGSDTVTGGDGADKFRFAAGGGSDTISDFIAGEDQIVVEGYASYQSAVQQGADTLIIFAGGEQLLLKGVQASSLHASDFVFSADALPDTPVFPDAPLAPDTPTGFEPPAPAYPLIGGAGNDKLTGGDLNDLILGLGGRDHIDGGSGDDHVDGGLKNDQLLGGDGDDVLHGGDGADTLDGGAGVNELWGDAGADVFNIFMGEGADTIQGFSADEGDLIRVVGQFAGYGIILSQGDVSLNFGPGVPSVLVAHANVDDVIASIELWGTSGDDAIGSTPYDDRCFAGAGNDTIIGYFGNDYGDGGAGNDTLRGDFGDDTLFGGRGADTLTGCNGFDTEEKETDVFLYVGVADSRKLATADLITDLEKADRIDLSAIDADGDRSNGDQAFVLVKQFGHIRGELMLSYDKDADLTLIMADVNGDGKADMTIIASGDHHGFTGFVL